jgi:predicted HicB family RNase H-like nuclease
MGRSMKQDHDAFAQITLRLPPELKARVEERAAAEDRSVVSYVRRTLDRATAEPQRHGEAAA